MRAFDPTVTRRTALLATGAAGLAATVAACSAGPSAVNAPDASSPGGAGDGSAAGASGQHLAALDKIPVGQAVAATLHDGQPVVVARPSPQRAACFSAICTHMGCTVQPAGGQLRCPCHGSVYSAVTGQVVSGPAPRPLPRIPVTVHNGEVVTTGGAAS
jgi:cytochrome b6-f complex iron-sulfur subunit